MGNTCLRAAQTRCAGALKKPGSTTTRRDAYAGVPERFEKLDTKNHDNNKLTFSMKSERTLGRMMMMMILLSTES
jgi:hypothetical protein